MFSRILLLTSLIAAAPAAAEERLVYDIFSGTQVVGTREVVTTVLPEEPDLAPETRLVTVTTKVDSRVAGLDYQLHSRADARITSRKVSFVASTQTNGETVEVQARQDRDGGWLVTAVTPGAVQELSYRSMEVDLTSVDLGDPVRHALLNPARPSADVLLVETGTVVGGAVRDLGEATLQVGDRRVAVSRVEWRPATGPITLAWTTEGTLVSYDMQVLGSTLTARLRALPAPPSWEGAEVSTDFTQPGTAIHEQEL